VFYDRTNRREPTFQETRDTVSGDFRGGPALQFVPNRRTDHLVSVFLQDDIDVVADRLHIIVGSKIWHNGYSGVEAQPSGRILWTPTTRQTIAGSITRAIRTPSRVIPSETFQSERLLAYELQYRVQPSGGLSLSLSSFLNRHEGLLTIEPGTPILATAPPQPQILLPIAFGGSAARRTA